ncbi:DUF4158 domain-containing protein [Salinifilum aidingensis]
MSRHSFRFGCSVAFVHGAELDQDELVEHWTLIGDDLDRVAGKRGAAKLGFALLLKFFAARGRFPVGAVVLRTRFGMRMSRFLASQRSSSVGR